LHPVDAGDVAAGAAQTRHQTSLDRIDARGKDDRNGRCRRFCGQRSRGAERRDDNCHLPRRQFGRDLTEPRIVAVRPAIFDRDIAALVKARFAQALPECRDDLGGGFGGGGVEEADHRHRPLLRARRQRPGGGRAAE
jgi:hypothetical protein